MLMSKLIKRVTMALLVGLPVAGAHAGMTTNGSHWVTVNGHPMYYQVQGNGGVLLLLHGGGDSGKHSFARQLRLFSQRHRLILPDQMGQGRTPDIVGPLTYQGMLNDTVALLNKLKLREVDVMGFSDGGILALMLAVQHPELTRRIVISGVNVAPDGLAQTAREGLRAMLDGDDANTVDAKLRQLWLNSPTPQELTLGMLSSIKDPVLVMSGDHDVITLEHTLQIYRAIPRAQLCVLPDTEHDTFTSRAGWVNSIALSFLK